MSTEIVVQDRPHASISPSSFVRAEAPFKVAKGMSKIIPLTRGYQTVVDDEDHAWLSQWKWRALIAQRTVYAIRTRRRSEDATTKPWFIRMHRQLLGLGRMFDSIEVDHKNGDGLDNQRHNLRMCQHAYNLKNMRAHADSSSSFVGVSWYARDALWEAKIMVDGHRIFLGRFSDELSAAKAHDTAAREHFGCFARLNLP